MLFYPETARVFGGGGLGRGRLGMVFYSKAVRVFWVKVPECVRVKH